MRNLKRVLSLALAAIMLLGMMVMGTSAASISDFTDADKITNLEAASVTTALEIFSGYGDGTFRGEDYVNRAEMATIICKILLGSKVNANIYKGIGSFQDLAGYEWAEGYINLCYSRGIVNGTSATTYEPSRPVKTWEAALMLQRALGWWAKNDPLNATISEITVSSKSSALGLYGDLVLYADDYLTRNDVAEMVFNAITKSVPVEYNESFSLYRNAGSSSIFSGVVYDYTDTLAYRTFGLVYDVDTADAFGRPATTWGYGKLASTNIDSDGNIRPNYNGMTSELVVVPNTPVLEYTTTVSNNTLYTELGMKKSDSFTLFVDGRQTTTAAINRNSTDLKDASAKTITGNGVLTQVFDNPRYDGTVLSTVSPYIVVVINTYVMGVDGVYDAKDNQDAYVTVKALDYNVAGAAYPYSSNEFDATYETEDFDRDDVVLVTVALEDPEDLPESENQYKIQTMRLADYTNGTLTRYSRTKGTATVGGVVYNFNKNTNQYAHDYIEVGGALKDDVVVYLDNYGYAVDVQKVSQDMFNDYALVIAVDKDSSNVFETNNAWVKMILADGSTATGKFTWTARDDVYPDNGKDDQLGYDDLANLPGAVPDTKPTLRTGIRQLVTYSVNKDGVYTLKDPAARSMTGLKTENNESAVKDFSKGSYKNVGFLNSASVMFVETDKDKFTVYTGVKNVPNITDEAAAGSYVANTNKTGLIDALYTTAKPKGSTSSDLIYIVGEDHWVSDSEAGPYVVFTAIVNGESTELNVKGKLMDDKTVEVDDSVSAVKPGAVFTGMTEKDGIVISVAKGTSGAPGDDNVNYYVYNGFIRANRTVIGVGTDSTKKWFYTWSDDVQVMYVDEKHNVSTPSITNIKTNEAAKVIYGVSSNNAGEVTWIYVIEEPETQTYTIIPGRATDLFTVEGVYFRYVPAPARSSGAATFSLDPEQYEVLAGGNGTSSNPYRIYEDAKWDEIAEIVADALEAVPAINAKYHISHVGNTVKMVEREAGEGAPEVYNIGVSADKATPDDITAVNEEITGTISLNVDVKTKVSIGGTLPTKVTSSDDRVVASITWTDADGNPASSNVGAGKYTGTISVDADTGYVLTDSARFRVNGGSAKPEAKIDTVTIEVVKKEVTEGGVTKTVIEGPIDITVKTNLNVGETLPAAATADNSNVTVNIAWTDANDDPIDNPGATQVTASTYTCTITVTPTNTNSFTLAQGIQYTVNGVDATMVDGKPTVTVTVNKQQVITGPLNIVVSADDIKVGDTLPTASVQDKDGNVVENVTTKIAWTLGADPKTAADAKGEYTATIIVEPKAGYKLETGVKYQVNGIAVTDGAPCTAKVKVYQVINTVAVTVTGNTTITLKGDGSEKGSDLPTVASGTADVTLASSGWKDSKGNAVAAADALAEGTYTYALVATANAADFVKLADKVTFTGTGVDGNVVKVTVKAAGSNPDPTPGDKTAATIAVTITDLESSYKVDGNMPTTATVAVTDKNGAIASANGKVTAEIKWTDKDGNTANDFSKEGEYTATITVETKEWTEAENYTLSYTLNGADMGGASTTKSVKVFKEVNTVAVTLSDNKTEIELTDGAKVSNLPTASSTSEGVKDVTIAWQVSTQANSTLTDVGLNDDLVVGTYTGTLTATAKSEDFYQMGDNVTYSGTGVINGKITINVKEAAKTATVELTIADASADGTYAAGSSTAAPTSISVKVTKADGTEIKDTNVTAEIKWTKKDDTTEVTAFENKGEYTATITVKTDQWNEAKDYTLSYKLASDATTVESTDKLNVTATVYEEIDSITVTITGMAEIALEGGEKTYDALPTVKLDGTPAGVTNVTITWTDGDNNPVNSGAKLAIGTYTGTIEPELDEFYKLADNVTYTDSSNTFTTITDGKITVKVVDTGSAGG